MMHFDKSKILRGTIAALSSAFIGVAISDTISSHDSETETFYAFNMAADAGHFQAVSGHVYTEHSLWRPFSEGQMLSQQLFLNNPFAGFELEYRNSLLSKFTGVRYVSDVRILPTEEIPGFIKKAAPFTP